MHGSDGQNQRRAPHAPRAPRQACYNRAMNDLRAMVVQLVIILPLAAAAVGLVLRFGWARRDAFAEAPVRHIPLGLLDVAGAMAAMVLGMAAGQLLIPWLGLAAPEGETRSPMNAVLVGLVGQLLVSGLACAYVVGRCLVEPGGLREVGLWRGPIMRVLKVGAIGLGVGLPMVIGLAAILGLAMVLMGSPPPPVGHDMLIALQGMTRPIEVALLLLSAVVLAPLFEEILFRGLLQTAIGRLLGTESRWMSIGICSLLFALTHGSAGVPPHGIAALVLLAVVLGWTYERTGSLWPAILIHAGFNAFNIAMVALLA